MKIFLKKYKIKSACFVDDVKKNLETANQFGLSTIWLTNEKESPSYIDKKISTLKDLITD
jgi:FMN phosphatase YigB (HAD superfamily)